jgi:branched-chain amino acid transport system ATP-binding protein
MLEVKGLTVSYGGIQAVKGISFHVSKGELVCLIGCNGAGKTTTLKALAGLLPFEAHELSFEASADNSLNLVTQPAHERLPSGMALVPEGRGVFKRMTIEENLELGAYHQRNKSLMKEDLEKMYATFPRLKERRQQNAGTLSGGEQQMLAIGRALMGRPSLLLLDEPSMGLAPIMVEKIFEVIQKVSDTGTTILLVEQNAHIALQIADRGYVMDSGMIEFEGQASSLLTDPRVREAYLGDESAMDVNESA